MKPETKMAEREKRGRACKWCFKPSSGLVRFYLGFSSPHIVGTFAPETDPPSLYLASMFFVYGGKRGGVAGLARGVSSASRRLVFLSELPKMSRKQNLHFRSEQGSVRRLSVDAC